MLRTNANKYHPKKSSITKQQCINNKSSFLRIWKIVSLILQEMLCKVSCIVVWCCEAPSYKMEVLFRTLSSFAEIPSSLMSIVRKAVAIEEGTIASQFVKKQK